MPVSAIVIRLTTRDVTITDKRNGLRNRLTKDDIGMLKHIGLENWRNHIKFDIDLDRITIIIGANGAGKTNILEALSMLSFCRSFRDDDKKNLINVKANHARIIGDEQEVFIARLPRLILKARIKGTAKKIADFIGYLPGVVFSPETISIITDTPGCRRRFLDIMLSQVNKEYLISLINFKKIRSQRNNLLQRIGSNMASPDELSFWNDEFVKESSLITKKRGESVEFLNEILSGLYQKISGNDKDLLKIEYLKNYDGNLLEELEKGRAREIAYGGTIFGPHRDDLVFKLNAKNMANFASRGELKSAILALKIAELKYLETKPKINDDGNEPILLLDDIFSEFDPIRREHLSKLILEYQTVITATEKEHVPGELLNNASIIEIKN